MTERYVANRLRKGAGTYCICCNVHEKDTRAMDDDWLSVVGRPTIPHVSSLRAPPSQFVELRREKLLGFTNREASRRYLQRLQRDRLRDNEMLQECVENLPIRIKQMAYPEKTTPRHGDPWRLGNDALSDKDRSKPGNKGEYWHENIEQWMKTINSNDTRASPVSNKQAGKTGGESNRRKKPRHGSGYSQSQNSSSFSLQDDFVHYPGFQGISGQYVKYKYGKKMAPPVSHSSQSTPTKFKSSHYGSLHDELEFQRRYKKVFDLDKHIHFVHSNFISGQRIVKRTKLPPIGHIRANVGESPDENDIYAIMSVHKFNHPENYQETRAPVTTPSDSRSAILSPLRSNDKRENRESFNFEEKGYRLSAVGNEIINPANESKDIGGPASKQPKKAPYPMTTNLIIYHDTPPPQNLEGDTTPEGMEYDEMKERYEETRPQESPDKTGDSNESERDGVDSGFVEKPDGLAEKPESMSANGNSNSKPLGEEKANTTPAPMSPKKEATNTDFNDEEPFNISVKVEYKTANLNYMTHFPTADYANAKLKKSWKKGRKSQKIKTESLKGSHAAQNIHDSDRFVTINRARLESMNGDMYDAINESKDNEKTLTPASTPDNERMTVIPLIIDGRNLNRHTTTPVQT